MIWTLGVISLYVASELSFIMIKKSLLGFYNLKILVPKISKVLEHFGLH